MAQLNFNDGRCPRTDWHALMRVQDAETTCREAKWMDDYD